jgi:hypothetical protein
MGLHGVLEFRGGCTPDDLAQFAPIVDQVQAQQLGALDKYLSPAL